MRLALNHTYEDYVKRMQQEGYLPCHIHSKEVWEEIVKEMKRVRT